MALWLQNYLEHYFLGAGEWDRRGSKQNWQNRKIRKKEKKENMEWEKQGKEVGWNKGKNSEDK